LTAAFRPSQQAVLRYAGGRLGISAVPGAGKTHMLSALAAKILQEGGLGPGQEVLIVTLVNSAVDTFKSRIADFVDSPALTLYRYRVRTLHGLAHDIVRERPGHVGLEEQFDVVDEHESNSIRADAIRAWLAVNPNAFDGFLTESLGDEQRRRIQRHDLPGLLESVSVALIRTAKDRNITPADLGRDLGEAPGPLPLAEFATAIYADYQRALAYRGAVDFDDLIRLALLLLQTQQDVLQRFRHRYPYILEDEAQDSSVAQESILRLLAGTDGNWVRVGDPNQAIYETFTTASPQLLRTFIVENPNLAMDESGRSQPSIIALANRLIDWVASEHPWPEARGALVTPRIRPAPIGDPKPNPPDEPAGIAFLARSFRPADEIDAVVKSLVHWLPAHPDRTVAVLVPRNAHGADLITALEATGLPTIELLGSTSTTRQATAALCAVLAYLAEPHSPTRLADAYAAWRTGKAAEAIGSVINDERKAHASETTLATRLKGVRHVEAFLAPPASEVWDRALGDPLDENQRAELSSFRTVARRWLAAAVLPIDQLVLTVSQDLFGALPDLALAYQLASLLGHAADVHPGWRLPELTGELRMIAQSERRFLGLSADESGFNPDDHPGKVVVTTVHKAKGLEWDRVYLMSVNDYDFPSGSPSDSYQSEKWFWKGHLNAQAEALAQMDAVIAGDSFGGYEEGTATARARLDYVRERLRLLYVGITRARRELVVTWNTGRRGNARPSVSFEVLRDWFDSLGASRPN